MEGWAEIWDIPEVVFPLRMARTREEFDRIAVFDFEVEVRGPDSTRLEDCSIELCDDMHEIYFHPKRSGLHQIRIKVDNEDFCPPIHLSVREDGAVKTAKPRGNPKGNRQRPTRERYRRDDEQHRENDRERLKTPSTGSRTSDTEEMPRLARSSSRSSGSSQSDKEHPSGITARSHMTQSSNYISGPNGELFVETDGRLVPVKQMRSLEGGDARAEFTRRERRPGRVGSSPVFRKASLRSSDGSALHSCSLCNKLVKLKKLLLLERMTYCKHCFKLLFMTKGPQQHLEALQPRDSREVGLAKRDSRILHRYSQHPIANLTGLKIKDVKYAQTEFATFDRYTTGKADRRFLDPLLRASLSWRLSERKTKAAMADQNTRQAVIRCGLNGPGEMTSLEFLNIFAFAVREKTTSWLAESVKRKSKMKRSPMSAPNLTDLPTEPPIRRDSGGSESRITAARLVSTLETIPSADNLDSGSGKTEPPETPIPTDPWAVATGPPTNKEEKEFGVTHGDADAWMMY